MKRIDFEFVDVILTEDELEEHLSIEEILSNRSEYDDESFRSIELESSVSSSNEFNSDINSSRSSLSSILSSIF